MILNEEYNFIRFLKSLMFSLRYIAPFWELKTKPKTPDDIVSY